MRPQGESAIGAKSRQSGLDNVSQCTHVAESLGGALARREGMPRSARRVLVAVTPMRS